MPVEDGYAKLERLLEEFHLTREAYWAVFPGTPEYAERVTLHHQAEDLLREHLTEGLSHPDLVKLAKSVLG